VLLQRPVLPWCPRLRAAAMIIRQTLSIARHLLAGAMLGALVFGMVKSRRAARRDEPLEPRTPPPEAPQPAGQG